MINLSGRTQIQQERIECQILAKGSLWPRIEALHAFAFTRKELNAVSRAKETIAEHRTKCKKVFSRDSEHR